MRSNVIIGVTLLSFCISNSVMAAPGHKDGGYVNSAHIGFQNSSLAINTVAQVKQMSDDERVVLRGYIVQSLGDEEYLFKDDSGAINIEIDHKRWRGQIITPNDFVEIQGKIDKDWSSITIDVKRIVKVEQSSN